MITSNPPGPFDPTWDSLERYQVPEWYLDAKFGIFIHWGVYTVPAFGSEWYPRNMYQKDSPEYKHHLATYGPHTEFGYKDFVADFKAEHFDATEWAELFRMAGAKFVVPVAEHHDGFAMYPTKHSRWNALQMGPKRDVIGELAASVRANGMIFGVSSHRIENWWFYQGGREFPSDVQDPANADLYGPASVGGSEYGKNPPSEAFMDDWLARCAELVDLYRPQLFWFDWWIEQPVMAPYRRRFASYYYNRGYAWGQGVAINYKHHAFPEAAAVFDVERGGLAEIRPRFWQTDTAVAKNSWSYTTQQDYKEPSSVIHDLIDIVSKNGALLLNIGPKSDGTIPEGDAHILHEIGGWLAKYGEAIYGTRPWRTYGEGPTKVVEGEFKDTSRVEFTAEDVRFTQKNGVLYVILLAPVAGTARVRSLGSSLGLEPREITAVETIDGRSLSWNRSADSLTIDLNDGDLNPYAVAIKVTFQ